MLVTSHGEVLIVEQKPREQPSVSLPHVVASRSTLQTFAAPDLSSGADPLQQQDPWQQYLEARQAKPGSKTANATLKGLPSSSTALVTGPQAVTPADFQSLVRRLEDSVHAQVTGQVAKAQGEVQNLGAG